MEKVTLRERHGVKSVEIATQRDREKKKSYKETERERERVLDVE